MQIMKRAMFVTMAVLLALPAIAQSQQRGGGQGRNEADAVWLRGDAIQFLLNMNEKLGLNEEKVKEVKAVHATMTAKLDSIRKEMGLPDWGMRGRGQGGGQQQGQASGRRGQGGMRMDSATMAKIRELMPEFTKKQEKLEEETLKKVLGLLTEAQQKTAKELLEERKKRLEEMRKMREQWQRNREGRGGDRG